MRPAFSVVFLTTLIGAGQGLFLALFGTEVVAAAGAAARPEARFFVAGAVLCVALGGLGLAASFFHLGRPERAWRSAAMWRTSWLSREVIALPAFLGLATAWGAGHALGWGATLAIGALGAIACLALFFCTAMIYACIKFLQEWASPYTIANFFLMGSASGFTLAAALAAALAPALAASYAGAALLLTLAALAVRSASLARNARIAPRSTLQSAIGVRGPVRQVSQGFTVRSFNTEEFFHGRTPATMRRVRLAFMTLAFFVPALLLLSGVRGGAFALLLAAFVVQYAGLVLERWYFLAQANHPQNLYYQNKA